MTWCLSPTDIFSYLTSSSGFLMFLWAPVSFHLLLFNDINVSETEPRSILCECVFSVCTSVTARLFVCICFARGWCGQPPVFLSVCLCAGAPGPVNMLGHLAVCLSGQMVHLRANHTVEPLDLQHDSMTGLGAIYSSLNRNSFICSSAENVLIRVKLTVWVPASWKRSMRLRGKCVVRLMWFNYAAGGPGPEGKQVTIWFARSNVYVSKTIVQESVTVGVYLPQSKTNTAS